MSHRLILPLVVLPCGLLFLALPLSRGEPTVPIAPAVVSNRAVGSVGCAGRSCHGGPVGEPTNANSATCWLADDPYAGAYRALLLPRSRAIVRALSGGADVPADAAARDLRCLACHVTPELAASAPTAHVHGVACEACHGAAREWLGPHTAWANAPDRTARADRTGFVRLDDPQVRGQVCAGCHVGAPPADGVPLRDVNHDLIAAGHPRLTFELATYQALLPRHWPERATETPLARWSAGQLATARAGLDLLAHRTAHGPWPELAEFDCAACHHELAVPSWRQQAGKPADRAVGSLPWNRWAFSRPLEHLTGTRAQVGPLVTALSQPASDPATVRDLATKLRAALPARLETPAPATLARTFGQADLAWLTWDDAAQFTYAYTALQQTRPIPEAAEPLAELRRALTLPRQPHLDSPHGYRPPVLLQTLRERAIE